MDPDEDGPPGVYQAFTFVYRCHLRGGGTLELLGRMPSWYGGSTMTYVIAEPCIDVKNQSCVDVCPVSCIYLGDDAADRLLYINPDECIECGACEPECPVTAIFHDSAVPAEWAEYTELNARWFNDADGVRARVDEISPPAG